MSNIWMDTTQARPREHLVKMTLNDQEAIELLGWIGDTDSAFARTLRLKLLSGFDKAICEERECPRRNNHFKSDHGSELDNG